MNALFILNSAPYGDERTYNGLRLAGALAKQAHNEVRVFLMGDAIGAAHRGQKVPTGFYNLQSMINRVALAGEGRVGVCGSCMDARGISADHLVEGTHRGSMDELAMWSEAADKVFVF